jgi:hypothetical protein
MLSRKQIPIFALLLLLGAMLTATSSCSKSSQQKDMLSTSPLYDTLGWFVQGGNGMVSGRGTQMISDPAHPGTMIQAGRLAIRTVVDTSIFVIASDPQMQPYFPVLLGEVSAGNLSGFLDLENELTNFIQQAVSGQKIYTGLSMQAAHNHASNSRFGSNTSVETKTADAADFDRFVSDVAMAANKLQVPPSVIGQLGALLNTTKSQVVQR